MAKKHGQLALIIPFYNEENYLPRLLQSFEIQPATLLLLIFVNNNSTDRSVQIVRAFASRHPLFQLVILQEANQGFHFARKRGLDYALRSGASIFAGIDADCELPKNFVSATITTFQKYKADAMAGRVAWHPQTLIGIDDDTKLLLRKRSMLQQITWDYFGIDINGAYYAIRASAYRTIKGWSTMPIKDKRILAEDFDISRRLHILGATIVPSSNVVIYSDRRLQAELHTFLAEHSHLGLPTHITGGDRHPLPHLSKRDIPLLWQSSVSEYANRIIEYTSQMITSDYPFIPPRKTIIRIGDPVVKHFFSCTYQSLEALTLSKETHRDGAYEFLKKGFHHAITLILEQDIADMLLRSRKRQTR